MKRILPISFCFSLFVIHSCSVDLTPHIDLIHIEKTIECNSDSAYVLLRNINLSEYPDQSDQAYYYILLSEVCHKKREYLLENDSLLNISFLFFKKQNNNLLISKTLLNKGRIWAGLHDHKEALELYYKSLNILEKIENKELLSAVYFEIGNVYLDKFIIDEALSKFNKSYYIDSLNGRKDNMIVSLGKIGQTYLFGEKPKDAILFFDRAHQLVREINDSLNYLGAIYNYYSVYYNLTGDYQLALDFIAKSILHSKENEIIDYKYLSKGEIYGSIYQYDSAQHYLGKSAMSDNLYTKTASYYCLFEIEKSRGNLENAINYLIEYQEGVDSIVANDYKSETEKSAYKYNVDRAVSEISAKNKITIYIIILSFSVLLLSVIIFLILRDKKRKLNEKEKERERLINQKIILEKEKEIRDLIHKINTIQTNISKSNQFKIDISQYEELIITKKEELFALLRKNADSCCDNFKKQLIYSKIIELSTQKRDKTVKLLTYQEQEILDSEIKKNFFPVINELKKTFPSLTNEDINFCCLALLKLSTYSISLCYAVSGTNTIKQRKHRIRKKMVDDSEMAFMFDFIFAKDQVLSNTNLLNNEEVF